MSQVVTAFKFDNQSKAPNTINQFEEVKAYIVSYVDGEGKDQVRLCFRPVAGGATFVLQERINGSFVATTASKWFNNAMAEKLGASPVESI
jgi:hypothetical protein